MPLNESIVEDAALKWFGELGYAVEHGPQLAPGEPAAERDSFSKVLLVGRPREAIPSGGSPRREIRELLVGRPREAIRRLNPVLSVADAEEVLHHPERQTA